MVDRPAEGSRGSRGSTTPAPTSGLKARGPRAGPGLEPHSAAPRSVRQQHQHGHGEPRGDRLRDNKLVHKVATWVASAVARRVELWDDVLVVPPALAACPVVLAFGDELVVLPDDESEWILPGGRDLAAVYLLPRAETVLRQELLQSRCSGWPTPPRELAKARAHPRAARARCDGPRACWRAKARKGLIGRAQPRALARDVPSRGLLTTKQDSLFQISL